MKRKREKNVLSQANISDTPFDHRSQRHPEVGVSRRHGQTDKRGNSMTESAQRADSVKTR